ncbi:hypothetical protein [Azospirillum largimobile]
MARGCHALGTSWALRALRCRTLRCHALGCLHPLDDGKSGAGVIGGRVAPPHARFRHGHAVGRRESASLHGQCSISPRRGRINTPPSCLL